MGKSREFRNKIFHKSNSSTSNSFRNYAFIYLFQTIKALSILNEQPVLNFVKSRARPVLGDLLQEFLRTAMYFESSFDCNMVIIFFRK